MVWHCTLITPSTGCIMDSLYTAEPEISPLFISLIKTWCLHYPACNFAKEWHHWKQFFRIACSFLWSHKSFYTVSKFPSGVLFCVSLVQKSASATRTCDTLWCHQHYYHNIFAGGEFFVPWSETVRRPCGAIQTMPKTFIVYVNRSH